MDVVLYDALDKLIREKNKASSERVNVIGNATGTVTLDVSLHNNFRITPTGDITIAFSNAPADNTWVPFTIDFANSTYLIYWPTGTTYLGSSGAAPEWEGRGVVTGWVGVGGVVTFAAQGEL